MGTRTSEGGIDLPLERGKKKGREKRKRPLSTVRDIREKKKKSRPLRRRSSRNRWTKQFFPPKKKREKESTYRDSASQREREKAGRGGLTKTEEKDFAEKEKREGGQGPLASTPIIRGTFLGSKSTILFIQLQGKGVVSFYLKHTVGRASLSAIFTGGF